MWFRINRGCSVLKVIGEKLRHLILELLLQAKIVKLMLLVKYITLKFLIGGQTNVKALETVPNRESFSGIPKLQNPVLADKFG